MRVLFDNNLKINKIIKYLLEGLMLLGLFWICDEAGSIKYVVVLLFGFLLLFLKRKRRWSTDAVVCTALPMVVYLIMGSLGAFLSAHFFNSTLKVILFWMAPYVVAFSLYVYYGKQMGRIVDFQFISSCIVFFKPNPLEILAALHFESVYAFTFGLFAVYYAYKKRWGMLTVSLLFMYMSDKRITFLALVAALAVMGVMWVFRNNRKLALFIWSIVAVVVNLYIYLIYSGDLEYYCRGLGINTNGRLKMYGRLAEWFDRSFLWLGKGVGVVEMLLEKWGVLAFANLHNDLLKFYVELGFIGLLLFLISFGVVFFLAEKRIGKAQMSFCLAVAVYSMILFATDNVSIYILYLIPMYSMCFAVLGQKEEALTQG